VAAADRHIMTDIFATYLAPFGPFQHLVIYLVDGSLRSTVGLSLYIRFLLEFVQLFDIGLLITSCIMAPMAIQPMYQQHILHCMSLSIAYHSRCVLDGYICFVCWPVCLTIMNYYINL